MKADSKMLIFYLVDKILKSKNNIFTEQLSQMISDPYIYFYQELHQKQSFDNQITLKTLRKVWQLFLPPIVTQNMKSIIYQTIQDDIDIIPLEQQKKLADYFKEQQINLQPQNLIMQPPPSLNEFFTPIQAPIQTPNMMMPTNNNPNNSVINDLFNLQPNTNIQLNPNTLQNQNNIDYNVTKKLKLDINEPFGHIQQISPINTPTNSNRIQKNNLINQTNILIDEKTPIKFDSDSFFDQIYVYLQSQNSHKQTYIVSSLYEHLPLQNPICKTYFYNEKQRQSHYDFHFNQNKKNYEIEKLGKLEVRKRNRSLFQDKGEFISQIQIDQQRSKVDESHLFYVELDHSKTDKKEISDEYEDNLNDILTKNDLNCKICGQKIELCFNQQIQNWVFNQAVKVHIEEKGQTFIVHYNCYKLNSEMIQINENQVVYQEILQN